MFKLKVQDFSGIVKRNFFNRKIRIAKADIVFGVANNREVSKAQKIHFEKAKLIQGGGGGKPDSAMAGGKDATKVDDALAAAADIVKGMLK